MATVARRARAATWWSCEEGVVEGWVIEVKEVEDVAGTTDRMVGVGVAKIRAWRHEGNRQ